MRLALLLVCLASASVAHADDACRRLAAPTFETLSQKARDKFPSGEWWQRTKNWKPILVTVYLARSPHVARTIVSDCGATLVSVDASDYRRLTSIAQIRVTSWQALARLMQLPATTMITARDTSIRIKHPEPHFFDDEF